MATYPFTTFQNSGIEASENPTEPNFYRLCGTHARRKNWDWIAALQFNGEMWPEEQMRVARLYAGAPIVLEALEDARKELEAQAAYFGSHLDPDNNLFRILRKLESVLKITKGES